MTSGSIKKKIFICFFLCKIYGNFSYFVNFLYLAIAPASSISLKAAKRLTGRILGCHGHTLIHSCSKFRWNSISFDSSSFCLFFHRRAKFDSPSSLSLSVSRTIRSETLNFFVKLLFPVKGLLFFCVVYLCQYLRVRNTMFNFVHRH